ncbi:MAG: hypothetical protein IPG45_33690 [Deltaproteobacteria bacterium]|nr:hypothetical protein [Deltaproteobacteria bacterium]
MVLEDRGFAVELTANRTDVRATSARLDLRVECKRAVGRDTLRRNLNEASSQLRQHEEIGTSGVIAIAVDRFSRLSEPSARFGTTEEVDQIIHEEAHSWSRNLQEMIQSRRNPLKLYPDARAVLFVPVPAILIEGQKPSFYQPEWLLAFPALFQGDPRNEPFWGRLDAMLEAGTVVP